MLLLALKQTQLNVPVLDFLLQLIYLIFEVFYLGKELLLSLITRGSYDLLQFLDLSLKVFLLA